MIERITMKKKPAFTLLELIMVIVILGIVASIGSSVIADVYENFLLQRATHRASLKTELAAQQIANLLSYRIPGTTLARDPDNLGDYLLVTDSTNMSDNTHTLLEWIGADNDSFSAAVPPGWDGFCDVAASNQAAIVTPGSDLALASTIISNLSNGDVSLSGSNYPAIFFRDHALRYAYEDSPNPQIIYDVKSCMGVVNANTSCISTVGLGSTNETLDFQLGASVPNKLISEQYKLAWTAYSIKPENKSNGQYDLKLYYNYQPWHGETISNAQSSTLITNVTVFKFAESGRTFRFKLCAQESIGEDFNITICKEKAIIL